VLRRTTPERKRRGNVMKVMILSRRWEKASLTMLQLNKTLKKMRIESSETQGISHRYSNHVPWFLNDKTHMKMTNN
jgi:hypothetical protein